MKTIINKETGLVLFCAKEFDLKDNEMAIDEICDLPYNSEIELQYWDFENKKFYVK